MVKPIEYEGRKIEPLTADDREDAAALAEYAKENGFDFIYRVPLDITGAPQGFAHPTEYALNPDRILGFDGSSLTGYQAINESDMLSPLLTETAIVDITGNRPRLRVLARVRDPIKGDWYERDPICIAEKVEAYLKRTGIADTAYFGPEPEFFIFDKASFEVTPNGAMYRFDSKEAWWNSGTESTGYLIDRKKGYAPLPPFDRLENVREDMMSALLFNGIAIETGHHEVATAGQAEIDMKFSTLRNKADNLVWYKHLVKNVAAKHGLTATFLPKAIMGDNGSGMHVHQSLWNGSGENAVPLFAGEEYGGLSELALHYIGGILAHGPALCALTNPATISYKRIVPHCEAPTYLVYSARNRSAAIRIPQYEPGNAKATRIEVRFPDPLASGHLAFAAMLMAGLDGIEQKLDPGKPFEGNVWEHSQGLKSLPGSLDEALDALEQDHEFLTKGGVFTEGFLNEWIRLKREECKSVRMSISPEEVRMYFGG